MRGLSQDATTMISAAQIRAARALLNINQEELAKIASVHVATIRRLETATGVRGAADTLWKLQDALERKGVEFIPEEAGKGPGVRLRQARDSWR
jgi:transcriptional regulator with XRE-family HTH domain